MPQESALFDQCDKFLRGLMKKASLHPKAFKLLKMNQLLENLTKTHENLQIIDKQLEEYMEIKRSIFPRFYFLSNDELVQMLAA